MTQHAPIPLPQRNNSATQPSVAEEESPPSGERAAVSAAARKTLKAVSRLPLTLPRMHVSATPTNDD